jgi:hypothetical protein
MQRNVFPKEMKECKPLTIQETQTFVSIITTVFSAEERRNISQVYRAAANAGWFGYGRF